MPLARFSTYVAILSRATDPVLGIVFGHAVRHRGIMYVMAYTYSAFDRLYSNDMSTCARLLLHLIILPTTITTCLNTSFVVAVGSKQ